MTPTKAGTRPASAARGHYIPTHYLRRLARLLVLRAAVSGRISWHVALPLLDRIGGV